MQTKLLNFTLCELLNNTYIRFIFVWNSRNWYLLFQPILLVLFCIVHLSSNKVLLYKRIFIQNIFLPKSVSQLNKEISNYEFEIQFIAGKKEWNRIISYLFEINSPFKSTLQNATFSLSRVCVVPYWVAEGMSVKCIGYY